MQFILSIAPRKFQRECKIYDFLSLDAPMDPGFLDVYTQWEHLLAVAKKLCDAQEENQEANKDFSSYVLIRISDSLQF